MAAAKISVIMPTYNHESFVGKAIESVLCQEGVDFEFLIFDDGSKDKTLEIVESYDDPRIKIIPNYVNLGACTATNILIENATGKYIALINSDDYWEDNNKLAIQLDYLEANPHVGACFGKARFVDKFDEIIPPGNLPFGHVFEQHNRSRGEWLRFFFDSGNCICHPTMLIRKQCYHDVGTYRNAFRQLPDYDMWIRLVKKWDIHIFDKVFINFRIMPGENASSPTTKNSIRTLNEHYLIACNYFDGISAEDLSAGFSDVFQNKNNERDEIAIDIEKALLLFSENRWLNRAYKMAALPKIAGLLGSPIHAQRMKESYDIDDLWFQNKMAEVDVLLPKIVADIQTKKHGIKKLLTKLKFF